MEDVATVAGVSRASVSRVLLGQGKVSDETRRRVREVADRMGYVPNVMASQLASRRTNTIGLLLRDASNPAYGLLFTELQAAARTAGLTLVSMTIGADDRGHHQVASLHHLLGMRVAGLIVATGGVTSNQLEPFRQRLPIVRAGRPETTEAIQAVSYDEHNTGFQLAEHVANLGHRDVAVLMTSEAHSYPEFIRGISMSTVLACRGVRVIHVPVIEPDDGVERVVALAREGTTTAVMCPTDTRQLAVLRGLRASGLSVPEDVSVSGCDGILPGADLLGLTTLRLPVEELARQVVFRIDELIKTDTRPAPVIQEQLRGVLVPGRTVAAPPAHSSPIRSPRMNSPTRTALQILSRPRKGPPQ